MKNRKIFIVLSMVFIALSLTLFCTIKINENNINKEKYVPHHANLKYLKFDEFDKLMIVAHPDDETIWGGVHLLKEKYLVICLTNGDTQRALEFHNALSFTSSFGIILNYPDKLNNIRSNWAQEQQQIKQDLTYVLQAKKWKSIVTHNPDGEYGHNQHKITSRLVTDILKQQENTQRLYYFGKYYTKKEVFLLRFREHGFDSGTVAAKNLMFSAYKSQMQVKRKLYHMFPYENWIKYTNWY